MAGERFAALFCFKYAEVPAAATQTKRAGVFLLLFLILARVPPLHGASSSRRQMRTEAPPTFSSLLFFFFLWQQLISIYEKKFPKKSGVKLSLSPLTLSAGLLLSRQRAAEG